MKKEKQPSTPKQQYDELLALAQHPTTGNRELYGNNGLARPTDRFGEVTVVAAFLIDGRQTFIGNSRPTSRHSNAALKMLQQQEYSYIWITRTVHLI